VSATTRSHPGPNFFRTPQYLTCDEELGYVYLIN